ncbi:DUF2752 domain-containing protein [Ruania halotolerans]|uniref:DUF2752 domain-containing protein n=1 Tax=Ruania halotolerans TaxID=2897773 RepID=UPI001E3B8DAB|nr:DUF2752 domain-containing protein [Ruania halotolerans]UFU08090.1 DUF2752 domain-containing protein [Ruania halotolerans]
MQPRDKVAPALLGAAMVAGTAVVVLIHPQADGPVVCPFLLLTGFLCPGCGGLRTTYALATADPVAAWDANPMLAVGLPVVAVLWLVWAVRSWRGLPKTPLPRWLPWLGAGVLAFWVLRNIPALEAFLGP